jgi:hypothetical protein
MRFKQRNELQGPMEEEIRTATSLAVNGASFISCFRLPLF